MRVFLVLLTLVTLAAQDIPSWVLPGILLVETKSYYLKNDLIYIDKRRGAHGERGPFQMLPIAFRQVALPGEKFADLERDMEFAEALAIRYLYWLYNGPARRSWRVAVGMWNVGTDYVLARDGQTAATYREAVREGGRDLVPRGWGG